MRRWALRIFILFILLLIAAVVTIQIVLSTDIPRRIVLKQLERTLSLRVGAKSMSTGWGGETVLEDVTLSLPLASESFLKVKTLRVKHTNLPALIVSRPLTIARLEFDEPELLVRQESSGQWNVLQAVELITRAGGGKQAADSAQPAKPEVAQIPEVVLKDGSVRVIDQGGKTANIQPLNIVGKPEGELVWRYDATAGPVEHPQLHVVGKLVPGGDWRHEITLELSDVGPWLKDWIADPSARQMVDQAVVKAEWRGNATANGVSGLLDLKDAHSGQYAARGAIQVDSVGGIVKFTPARFHIDGIPSFDKGISLNGGVVQLDSSSLAATNLTVAAAAGDARLNGRYGLSNQSVDLAADWNNFQFPTGYIHAGSMSFALRQNWTGLREVTATLTSTGGSRDLSWDGRVSLKGAGNTYKQINWSVVAEKLRVKRGKIDADLDQLVARGTNTPQEITLTDLSIPAGQLTADRPRGKLSGSGRYRWPAKTTSDGGEWYVNLTGDDWRVFEKRDLTAGFKLAAKGDLNAPGKANWLHLDEFSATTNDGLRIKVNGTASYTAPGIPVDLNAYMWYPPFSLQGYREDTTLQGRNFHSELHITGGAWPPVLDLHGSMIGTNVLISDRPVGNLSMSMQGRVRGDESGNYSVHLETDHLKLLRGDWDLAADYDSGTGDAAVDVKLGNLPLAAVNPLLKLPVEVDGTLVGQWKVKLPKLALKQSEVDGDFQIDNFRAPEFMADKITGHVNTNPSKVVVNRVRVLRNAGGEINAAVSFVVAQPTRLEVTANVAAWPVQLPAGSLIVYAQTTEPAVIDLKAKATHAPFKLDVYPTYRGINCGVIRAAGNVTDHVVNVTQIDGQGFGGKITGTASYDFDAVLKARANVAWTGLDVVQLAAMFRPPTPTTVPTATGPATRPDELVGRISGTATLGPPNDARPIAPLVLSLDIHHDDQLAWRAVKIDGATINVYYDPGTPKGERRIVVDNSELRFAGGSTKVFARVSRRPVRAATQPVSVWSFTTLVDGENLDLDQLVHTGAKNAKSAPGRLYFRTTLLGNPMDRGSWVGDGNARLEKSDLADTTIVGGLYAIMSVQFGKHAPAGLGRADFHFEGDNLSISSFYFSQRGVDVYGSGIVRDVWNVPDSPLAGYVTGTLRPLRDLKIPFAPSIDKTFSLLQRNLTTAKITGTVRDPHVIPGAFADIGDGLKQFLVNDLFGAR